MKKSVIAWLCATALCAMTCAVIIFRAGSVLSALSVFLSSVSAIIGGACLAFVLDIPLRMFEEKLFRRANKHGTTLWRIFRRPVCIFLSLLLVCGIIAVFVMLVLPEIKRTLTGIFTGLPEMGENLLSTISGLGGFAEKIVGETEINWESISAYLMNLLENSGINLLTGTLGVTGSVLSWVYGAALAVVFAVFLLSEKERLIAAAGRMLHTCLKPAHADRIIYIAGLSHRKFSYFISGQFLEALILGTLCFVGMLVFGFPYALTVSAIMTVTALIPVFGAIAGAAAGSLMMLLDTPIKAIWFLIFIILLQQVETNLIYPKVMSKSVGLPGLWVLIAVTVGGNLFGAIGLLTAVPFCSIIYCLVSEAVEKRTQKKQAEAEAAKSKHST